ncbi:MAG: hypothetical protein ACFFES_11560 [Candidatus Thorarchaeota archaeon]
MVALLGTTASTATAMGPGMGMDNPMTRPMPGMPDHSHMGDGTIWINTDVITIMANSDIPQIRFWYTSDTDGSQVQFMTSYSMLVEFEDLNDDDAYQRNETLNFAPLAGFEWTVTTGEVVEGDVITEVWLKYTKSGVKSSMNPEMSLATFDGMGDIQRFSDVTLQIWAHIYLDDYTGEITDDHGVQFNYTVAGRSELKMDIEIGNFPFTSADSSVAIETYHREHIGEHDGMHMHHRFETHERFRNVSLDADMNWTTDGGNETRFERMDGTHCQNMDFVDSESTISRGFFSWLDTAVITWPGGETEAVNVTASYLPRGDGVAVYLAYPYFDNGSILHDPSIGLYEEGVPLVSTPVNLTLIAGIGGVAIIALLIVMVRKK